MSLVSSLSNALSGLSVAQASIAVVSNNVSNLNTANYAREVAATSAVAYPGYAGGVQLDAITRQVDSWLNGAIQANTSDVSASTASQDYAKSIEAAFTPDGTTGRLDTLLSSFSSAVQSAIATPNDPTQRLAVVNAADALAARLNQIVQSLQGVQAEADATVKSGVQQAATLLGNFAQENTAIVSTAYAPPAVQNLQDQRDSTVAALAKLLPISSFDRAANDRALYTGNGRALFDRQASALTTATRDDGFTAVSLGGLDISSELQSGSIAADLNVRDKIVPGIIGDLDQLAGQIATLVNQASNAGTCPAPQTQMVSSTPVDDFSPVDLSKIDMVLTDSSGKITDNLSDQFQLPTSVTSLTDLKRVFDTTLVKNGQPLFSVSTDNGILKIAINPGGAAAGQSFDILSARSPVDFKSLFHLNDVFVGIAGSKRTAWNVVKADNNGPNGAGRLTLGPEALPQAAFYVGQRIYVTNPAGLIQMRKIVSYDPATRTAVLDSAWTSVPDAGSKYELNQPDASTIAVRADLKTNPERLPTGAFNYGDFALPTPSFSSGSVQAAGPSSITLDAPGTSALTVGDTVTITSGPGTGQSAQVVSIDPATGAAQLSTAWAVLPDSTSRYALGTYANLVGTQLAQAGDSRGLQHMLSQLNATFTAYSSDKSQSTTLSASVADLIATQTTRVNSTAADVKQTQAVQTELQSNYGSVSGVNIDEEMSQLIMLQNAYNASARVLSTVADLYKQLTTMTT
jgi:flagellar hook-associated protein 1